MRAINVFATILSLIVGLLFGLAGVVKLTPAVSDDIYKEMHKGFIRFAKVFPFAGFLGISVDPQMYCTVIGLVEVVGAIMLSLFRGHLNCLASVVLFVVMCGAVYTLVALGEPLSHTVPAIVFGLLVLAQNSLANRASSNDLKEKARAGGGKKTQ